MAASTRPLMLDLRLPITTWLDDETFYSLCCRFHRVAGNATASRTAQQLFGHPRHGTQHDFASRINVFVQRTQGHFGNAEAIILHHTLLPRSEEHTSELQSLMRISYAVFCLKKKKDIPM